MIWIALLLCSGLLTSGSLGAALQSSLSPQTMSPQITETVSAPPELVDYEHLPFAFAVKALRRLEVGYHDNAELAMAYYEPTRSGVDRPDGSESAPSRSPGSSERALRSARLLLHRESFGGEAERIEVGSLAIDQAEYLAFALLLAHLHDEVGNESELGLWLRGRASTDGVDRGLDSGLDEELADLLFAVASFGSHLLSVANEIERLERRLGQRGEKGLCRLMYRRLGLFMVWERAFEGDFVTSRPGSSNVVRMVKEAEKEAVLEQVLEGVWTGDAVIDFAERYCG